MSNNAPEYEIAPPKSAYVETLTESPTFTPVPVDFLTTFTSVAKQEPNPYPESSRDKEKEKDYSHPSRFIGTTFDIMTKRILHQAIADRSSANGEESSIEISAAKVLAEQGIPLAGFYEYVERQLPGYAKILYDNLHSGAIEATKQIVESSEKDGYKIVGVLSNAAFTHDPSEAVEMQELFDTPQWRSFSQAQGFDKPEDFVSQLLKDKGLKRDGKVIFRFSDLFKPLEQQPKILQEQPEEVSYFLSRLITYNSFSDILSHSDSDQRTTSSLGAFPDFVLLKALADDPEAEKIIRDALPDFTGDLFGKQPMQSIHLLVEEALERQFKLLELFEPDPITGKARGKVDIIEEKFVSSTIKEIDPAAVVNNDAVHTVAAVCQHYRALKIIRGDEDDVPLLDTIPYATRIVHGYMPVVDTHPEQKNSPGGGLIRRNIAPDIGTVYIPKSQLREAYEKYVKTLIHAKARKTEEVKAISALNRVKRVMKEKVGSSPVKLLSVAGYVLSVHPEFLVDNGATEGLNQSSR